MLKRCLIATVLAALLFSACDTGTGSSANPTEPPDNTEKTLGKPDALTVDSIGTSGVYVSWSGVENATSYGVILADGDTVTTTDTTLCITTLGDDLYWLYLIAQDSAGTITQSDSARTVDYRLPGSPNNQRLVTRSTSAATVSWDTTDGCVDGAIGYRLYLCDYLGAVIDSVEIDTPATSASVELEQTETVYKIAVVTVTPRGAGSVDSSALIDTSDFGGNDHYLAYRHPWLFVSTHVTPTGYTGNTAGDMVGVPGGMFLMGNIWSDSTLDWAYIEKPAHEVKLSSFFLGQHEVTAAQYASFLSGTDAFLNSSDSSIILDNDTLARKYGWLSWLSYDISDSTFTPVHADSGAMPMVGLTWKGAAHYCNWASLQENLSPCYNTTTWSCDITATGYRLPTEAEYEYVMSGGHKSLKCRFPWGYRGGGVSEAQSFFDNYETIYKAADAQAYWGFAGIMANVQEYCTDFADLLNGDGTSPWFQQCLAQGVVVNPIGPSSGESHIMKTSTYEISDGSKFYYHFYTSQRYRPCQSLGDYGFRLARTAP